MGSWGLWLAQNASRASSAARMLLTRSGAILSSTMMAAALKEATSWLLESEAAISSRCHFARSEASSAK